jgi:putative nucleotidyltransferase with HDIG domain
MRSGGIVRRILFVDDEPNVLDGLKRMLYPLRKEWTMTFTSSGQDALRAMSESEFDLLVTDVRMPGMSGIELLSEVVKRHPQVMRIVLSGTADQEVTMRSVTLAHQYLIKPCSAETLRATVERAFRLRAVLADPALRELVSRVQALPSIPAVYAKLMQALQSPDVTPQEVGRIVAQDMSMTAKILQLVNSSFFGVSRKIANPAEAVVYLGTETVKALVLTASVFSQFDSSRVPGFSIEGLRNHGLATGALAKKIAEDLRLSKAAVDDVFVGALIHDLGQLMLVHYYPAQYAVVLNQASEQHLPLGEAEQRVFGTGHAEVGAYLLWLWGLPDSIAEIVAHHHRPSRASEQEVYSVAAVHVADAISHVCDSDLDMDCLSRLRLTDRLPEWKALYERQNTRE